MWPLYSASSRSYSSTRISSSWSKTPNPHLLILSWSACREWVYVYSAGSCSFPSTRISLSWSKHPILTFWLCLWAKCFASHWLFNYLKTSWVSVVHSTSRCIYLSTRRSLSWSKHPWVSLMIPLCLLNALQPSIVCFTISCTTCLRESHFLGRGTNPRVVCDRLLMLSECIASEYSRNTLPAAVQFVYEDLMGRSTQRWNDKFRCKHN